MQELFIYYRCRAGDSAAVGAAVLKSQQALRDHHPGLEARLLRRPETAADGTVTWMETYRSAPGPATPIDGWPQAVLEPSAAVVAPWIVGQRHVEVFEPCAW